MMKGNHSSDPDLDRDPKIVIQMSVVMILPSRQFNVSPGRKESKPLIWK